MPLPDLPINVPYENQGQVDGDLDDNAGKGFMATHRKAHKDKPEPKGDVATAAMRFREE